jgi:Domain of unknown function (DUF4158)
MQGRSLSCKLGRAEDLIEIRRCRGADHRRRFALQLCMLRAHGRQAPLRIINHLSRQLDLPPVLLLDRPHRDPTERTQAQRIRRYLGIRSFDRAAEADLQHLKRQGRRVGAIPYGWRLAGDKRLEQDPGEQVVVELAREMRASGLTLRAICDALTERGYRTGPATRSHRRRS